jgi:hypothetical protein
MAGCNAYRDFSAHKLKVESAFQSTHLLAGMIICNLVNTVTQYTPLHCMAQNQQLMLTELEFTEGLDVGFQAALLLATQANQLDSCASQGITISSHCKGSASVKEWRTAVSCCKKHTNCQSDTKQAAD